MSRGRVAALALCALAAILIGWILLGPGTPNDEPFAGTPASTPAVAGIAPCPLSTLPPQAAETVRRIQTGGPFPYPRNDGVVFGNREGHLPDRAGGYYREYTVVTPGAKNRSVKRVVTGGAPVTDPQQYFYTADHYDSFCLITDAGRQP